MNAWRSVASWERRHRVIVAGRAFCDDGEPFIDAGSMWLVRTSDASAPAVSKRKDKRAGTVAVVASDGEAAGRRYACRIRADGRFFFLDVPAGRYVLQRAARDAAGAHSQDVTVPAFDEKTKLPVVNLEFEIARPAVPR